MTDSQSRPKNAAPHVPAAFINALSEEGTKDEAIFWLQKQWNECSALRAQLAIAQMALREIRDNARNGEWTLPSTFGNRADRALQEQSNE